MKPFKLPKNCLIPHTLLEHELHARVEVTLSREHFALAMELVRQGRATLGGSDRGAVIVLCRTATTRRYY